MPPGGALRGWPLAAFPAAKLLLHLSTIPGYGFFRDEFYYIACSERLDFGYVDHPPLSILILRLVRELLGDSVWALRLVPALAGAATVLVVGLIARALGGGRFAQSLAMLAALSAPVYLSVNHFYSMNAFDLLVWAVAAYLIVRPAMEERPRLWLHVGIVLGLGLQNKLSVLWLGFGLAAGLLATSRRKDLLTPWPWAGAGVAFLLFLPHLIWQVAHDWPTLEFIHNATQEKMVHVPPWTFLAQQLRAMNPAAAPVWIAGLTWLLGAARPRSLALPGWTYLAVFLLLAFGGASRAGYLAPAYTWLFAAGGVAIERGLVRLAPRPRRLASAAAPAVVALGGALMAPFGLPILPVEGYIAYAKALGVAPSTAERKELGPLPQFYADMHGWDAIVSTVADVYDRLPARERPRTAVFAFDYGVAGAVEFLGRSRGLTRVASAHNNYWLWGPGNPPPEVVIVVGGDAEGHRSVFASVTQAATIRCGLCMPYENDKPVFVCRKPLSSLEEVWPALKHFD